MRILSSVSSLLVAILLVFASCLWPSPAAAQSEPKSGASRLSAVEVNGSKRFSSHEITEAIHMAAGATIGRDDLQAGADKLANLGLFSKVQFHFTTASSGVKVTYDVVDAPSVPVAFDNFPWFSDEQLKAELKRTVLLFDGCAPQNGALLDAMASVLGNLVQSRGVLAHVTHQVTNSPVTDGSVQQFRVEGAEMAIQSLEFSDPVATNDHGIQDRLSDLIGKPYSRNLIALFEFEQVRPVYLSHAFLHVQFGEPNCKFPEDNNQPVPHAVAVLAPIEPGPAYAWSGVSWTGNSAVPSNELDALVLMKSGDVADGTKIEAIWERVQAMYGERGYLDAKVTAVPQFDDQAHHVAYTAAISEGPQYHMGNLQLTGLSLEGEKRIRTSWKIAPGAVFNKSIYEDFLDNGIKQSFAGTPIHYDKIGRFLQEDPSSSKVDVLLDFQ